MTALKKKPDNENPFAHRDTSCRRCGRCCKKGGPALHHQDLELIKNGRLAFKDLFTIRKGEPAYSPHSGTVEPATVELVKTATRPGEWACIFYDELNSGCGMYEHRPLECRLLKCWDPQDLLDMIGKDTLCRRDIVPSDHPILPLLDRHDRECSTEHIVDWIPEDNEHGNQSERLAELTELIQNDLTIRQEALRKFSLDRNEELFFFGRPLFVILRAHDLQVSDRSNSLQIRWQISENNQL